MGTGRSKVTGSSRKRRAPPGSPPGTLRSDPDALKPTMQVMLYGPNQVSERILTDVTQLKELLSTWPVVWLNVDGLGDLEVLKFIGTHFRLHPLALEDVCNLYQRPKIERYPDYYYVVARMSEPSKPVDTEQLSLFFGEKFVITFQERPGDCLNAVRDRIRNNKGRIRTTGPDYLSYAILDAVIDDFFPMLERAASKIEGIEEKIVLDGKKDKESVNIIYQTRQELLTIRRAIWPLRDALGSIARDPTSLIQDETRLYFRDCHDHTVQLIDSVESYRELASSLMEVFLSLSGYRLNHVMRTLTLISVLFMPLNFIAAVYGMNFNPASSPLNMPELNWYWGYPFALALMGIVGATLLIAFYRMGWLRAQD